ncbi:hypothetical protein Csa_014588 [Cucumis sativus]|nr:hypothetical protein Csa_014588 [Cucumis sativus]
MRSSTIEEHAKYTAENSSRMFRSYHGVNSNTISIFVLIFHFSSSISFCLLQSLTHPIFKHLTANPSSPAILRLSNSIAKSQTVVTHPTTASDPRTARATSPSSSSPSSLGNKL